MTSCTYNSVTSTFTYGSDGLRRSMTVGTNPTVHYALDGTSVVREWKDTDADGVWDTGESQATYLAGPRGVEYRRDDTANPQTVKWYIYDGLGSVVAEVDEDGVITSSQKMDVYGAVRSSGGVGTSKHKFVGGLGHTTEPDTGGLIYMRARWYDPQVGRFISEDPKQDGTNWYVYCNNNPVNLVDPNGQSAFMIIVAIILLIAVLIEIYAQYAGHEGNEQPHIPGAEENPALPVKPGGPGNRGPLAPPWAQPKLGVINHLKEHGSWAEKIAASVAETIIWTDIALYQ